MSKDDKSEQMRRSFIKKIGGGILLSTVASSLIRPTNAQQQNQLKNNEKLPPERRLGWAIIGLGDFGTTQIIPNFANSQRSKLVALVSGDRAKAEKFAAEYSVKNQSIYNYQNFDSIKLVIERLLVSFYRYQAVLTVSKLAIMNKEKKTNGKHKH